MTTADIEIVVPDIGGAGEVDVIEVLVRPGDAIKVDTPLITLESDKATMEVPSTVAGIVRELKVKVGDKITEGAPILSVQQAAEAAKNPEVQKTAAVAEQKLTVVTESTSEKLTSNIQAIHPPQKNLLQNNPVNPVSFNMQQTEAFSTEGVHAGPAVRKLARELGVNLVKVPPTGPKQRVLKEDIESYVKSRLAMIENGGASALPAAPVVDFAKFGPVQTQPLSRLKKISGKNLHRNWVLVPHVTQFGEADITELEAFRQTEKAALEKEGIKLTPLVFIMKAVVAALQKFPQFNASLDATSENLIYKNYFHIGVAVDTPEGLVVPVIRDVDQKGLATLARELSVLSDKARKKQLLPNEMQGGCFSISSLGGIGGTAFTPIVNLPEVAILGVSKASYKPIFDSHTFVPRLMLPLALSYDHRVIDGAEGARFIAYLSEKLSDIRKLLI